jgi:hypothetical protein
MNSEYLNSVNKEILDNEAFNIYFNWCIVKRLKYSIRYNADGNGRIVNAVGHFQREKGLNNYKHVTVRL